MNHCNNLQDWWLADEHTTETLSEIRQVLLLKWARVIEQYQKCDLIIWEFVPIWVTIFKPHDAATTNKEGTDKWRKE